MTEPKDQSPQAWILRDKYSNRALLREVGEKHPDDVNGEPSDKWIPIIEFTAYERLREELECERMRLAACGVAAHCNTEKSMTEQLVKRDNPNWSQSYQDVVDAVKREIEIRAELESARSEIVALETALDQLKDDTDWRPDE